VIIAFISTLVILVIVSALKRRLQQATLHWGRLIAGEGQIEQDIQEAKGAGDTGRAAELLGRSIHQRGLQDAITPPYVASLTYCIWAVCIGAYVWGWFVLPWYVAAPWPILFGPAQRMVKDRLPSPKSDYYRQKIIRSLESRQVRFKRQGDIGRSQATDLMLTLLRRGD
jgi:hypothetical protein